MSSSGSNSLRVLETLAPCKPSYGASRCHRPKLRCISVPAHRHQCSAHAIQKGTGQDEFSSLNKKIKFFFFLKVLQLCKLLKWLPMVLFAFYLNASLRLTPACEHCRTSIWNVLWRNPISGFNGSSEAAHPGSCEICALVKLVYLINFPIFNYWHHCCAGYCFSFFFFSCTKTY